MVVCHSSAPQTLGGGELSILETARRWQHAHPDIRLIFVVPDAEGLLVDELVARGLDHVVVHSFPWVLRVRATTPAKVLGYQRENAEAVSRLRSIIRDQGVDVVVTNTIVAPWGAVAAALEGVRHVWLVREYGGRDHGLSYQQGEDRTWTDIGRLSSAVVANSGALADFASEWIDRDILHVSYPPIDDDFRLSLESIPSPSTDAAAPLAVLIAGKLAESKGQAAAIDAIALLRAKGIEATLTIVGAASPPEYREELAERITELGLSSAIELLEQQPDVRDLISAADVCLTLSSWEAFGRVTLESMLAGRAVVGFDRGGTSELVASGITGTLVPFGDVAGVGSALAEYATNRDLVRAHGAAARTRASELIAGNGIGGLLDILSSGDGAPSRIPELFVTQMEQAASALTPPGQTSAVSPKRPRLIRRVRSRVVSILRGGVAQWKPTSHS